jgi:hypothetical protein
MVPVLSRLHNKRENRIGYSTGNTRENSQNLTVRELKTYRTRPAGYLRRWTGMLRAKAGGPGVSRMPLAVTMRTAVSYSSRGRSV